MGFGVAARRPSSPRSKMDQFTHYLTRIRFNHFEAASGNPCDGWRNSPPRVRSKLPEPVLLSNKRGKFTGHGVCDMNSACVRFWAA